MVQVLKLKACLSLVNCAKLGELMALNCCGRGASPHRFGWGTSFELHLVNLDLLGRQVHVVLGDRRVVILGSLPLNSEGVRSHKDTVEMFDRVGPILEGLEGLFSELLVVLVAPDEVVAALLLDAVTPVPPLLLLDVCEGVVLLRKFVRVDVQVGIVHLLFVNLRSVLCVRGYRALLGRRWLAFVLDDLGLLLARCISCGTRHLLELLLGLELRESRLFLFFGCQGILRRLLRSLAVHDVARSPLGLLRGDQDLGVSLKLLHALLELGDAHLDWTRHGPLALRQLHALELVPDLLDHLVAGTHWVVDQLGREVGSLELLSDLFALLLLGCLLFGLALLEHVPGVDHDPARLAGLAN